MKHIKRITKLEFDRKNERIRKGEILFKCMIGGGLLAENIGIISHLANNKDPNYYFYGGTIALGIGVVGKINLDTYRAGLDNRFQDQYLLDLKEE